MTSADEAALDALFRDYPDSRKLYEAVEQYILSLGAVDVEVTKTQVAFGAARKFAWAWLPQLWTKKRPVTSLTLAFALDHPLSDPRIASVVEPRPGRWTHHVVIEQETDLDETVKAWLRQAYENGQIDRRRRGAGERA